MKLIISIDLGTTKICAAAIDAVTLKPLAVASAGNDADIPNLPQDLHEQCPRRIWEIVCELVASLACEGIRLTDVCAVSISGQMHGVMLIDATGQPVGNFITWRDKRGCVPPWAGEYAAANGCELHSGYGGATLARLAQDKKIPCGVKAVSLADFMAFKLCGQIATEVTHAASWGIYDIQQSRWNSEMIGRLGIPQEVLCEVKTSGGLLGCVTDDAAKKLNLPAGMRVCSPVGDNQASVIGASGFSRNSMVLNLGTGGQVSIPCETAEYRGGFETRPMPCGGFIHVGASLCGGWSYAYLKDFCRDALKKIAGLELSDGKIYAKLNELAAARNDAGGLCVDTRFAGVRGDDTIRGSISGIDAHNFTIGNLSLGFMEGVVRDLFNMACPLLGDIDSVVASGNGIRKNPLMPELIEKIFGKKIVASTFEEEAAVGAAAASAVELGLLERENVENFCGANDADFCHRIQQRF